MLAGCDNPTQKLPEQRKRRIRHNDIGLIPQLAHLRTPEIPVTLQVMPLQIINVDAAVLVGIPRELEDLALNPGLVHVKQRTLRLKERRLIVLILLALDGIRRAN